MQRLVVALLLSVALSAPTSAFAATYTFNSIDVPGSSATAINGINDRGDLVGDYSDALGLHMFMFLQDENRYITFDSPNGVVPPAPSVSGPRVHAWAINNQRQVVGDFGQGSSSHGFLFSEGSFATFDVPGSTQTFARGINDDGTIVGIYIDTDLRSHGYLLSRGTFTTIDFPGSNGTDPSDINNSGDIAGFYSDVLGTFHGFLMSGHMFTTIDVPISLSGGQRDLSTLAFGINDLGDVVGDYQDIQGAVHDFLLSAGTYTTVDVVGSTYSRGAGINNEGEIVLYYQDAAHAEHTVVAIPNVESDTTPPVISGMPVNCTLWPPNHELIQVAMVAASDAESDITRGALHVSVTSNELLDIGDVVIKPTPSGALVVQLRAERLGNGNGRIYNLTATVVDLAGNQATATASCLVPHDLRQ